VFNGIVPVILGSFSHNLVEAGVDDINFAGTLEALHVGGVLGQRVAHSLKDLDVLFFLVLLGHTAGSNMVQVLEPLEVGTGDATAVGEHVGHDNDTLLLKNGLGAESSGSVGTLNNDLAVEHVSVVLVDSALFGGRDENIALLFHEIRRVKGSLLNSTRETNESAARLEVELSSVDINALRVVNGRVVLDDSNDLGTVVLAELGSPVSNSTEALNNDGLIFNALGLKERFLDEGVSLEEGTCAVVDAEAGGLSASLNATLGDEFAGAAALSIDVLLTVHVNIGVLDPGHDLLVGAHIGAEAIDLGANEAFLGELHGVAASDFLDLTLGVLGRVEGHTTLSATEGNVGNAKLEGHQRGKSHHLLKINSRRVPSAALDGELVMLVLGAVAVHNLDLAVVAANRNTESNDVVAGADHLKVILGDAGLLGGAVEEHLDLLEETGLLLTVLDPAEG
jgi:hypothetical protein